MFEHRPARGRTATDVMGDAMLPGRTLWLLILGLAAIGAGYLLLAAQRLSWGPLLLVAGYCVLLPLFIWRLFRE